MKIFGKKKQSGGEVSSNLKDRMELREDIYRKAVDAYHEGVRMNDKQTIEYTEIIIDMACKSLKTPSNMGRATVSREMVRHFLYSVCMEGGEIADLGYPKGESIDNAMEGAVRYFMRHGFQVSLDKSRFGSTMRATISIQEEDKAL